MTKVIKELSIWLVDEFYYDNIKKSKRIAKVINKNGYDINYDKLNSVKNYRLNDVLEYYRGEDILKRRK